MFWELYERSTPTKFNKGPTREETPQGTLAVPHDGRLVADGWGWQLWSDTLSEPKPD